MKSSLVLLASILALHGPATAAPAGSGLDENHLVKARDYALTGGGSGMVLHRGKLVMSWGDVERRHDLKSTTKSFGSAALGLAIADGLVNLDDPAVKHHPAFATPPQENLARGWHDQITLRQLAAHTSGFAKPGGHGPLLLAPGTAWAYSDAGPNWLAECLTLAWKRDVAQVLSERVFTPLGITGGHLQWRHHAYRDKEINGIARREFGSGISASVTAMARYGQLWLQGGLWDGKQLLPRDYIDTARRTQPGMPGLPVHGNERFDRAPDHYGLLWWNNNDEHHEGVPLDAYWSWGLGDSIIAIFPSHQLVAARAGGAWKRGKNMRHDDVLAGFLLPLARAAGFGPEASSAAPKSLPTVSNTELPAPPSPVIAAIEWAPLDSIIRQAEGSDNWPLTWAADDALYTAWGDGKGFESSKMPRLSLGLARLTGSPPDFTAENLRAPDIETEGGGAAGRKASGLLSVDGTLYLLARNVQNAQLAWSADLGKTWNWADWKFTESFGCPTFLNFGKDYAGARDGFVYVYSQDADRAYDRADRFVMARVPKEKIRDRAAYEFFVKLDAAGQPEWSRDIARRGAVFTHPGACYRSGISYNLGIKRYLWTQTGRGDDTRFKGGLTILDAPEPWGPWTTAFQTDDWDTGPGESMSFPPKWMSADGLTLHLVSSGNDCFSVRRATLKLRTP